MKERSTNHYWEARQRPNLRRKNWRFFIPRSLDEWNKRETVLLSINFTNDTSPLDLPPISSSSDIACWLCLEWISRGASYVRHYGWHLGHRSALEKLRDTMAAKKYPGETQIGQKGLVRFVGASSDFPGEGYIHWATKGLVSNMRRVYVNLPPKLKKTSNLFFENKQPSGMNTNLHPLNGLWYLRHEQCQSPNNEESVDTEESFNNTYIVLVMEHGSMLVGHDLSQWTSRKVNLRRKFDEETSEIVPGSSATQIDPI